MLAKFIQFVKIYQSDIVLALTVVLISVTAFNLGKLSESSSKKFPISIAQPEKLKDINQQLEAENREPKAALAHVIASKKSASKLYHFPWCSGASRISEKNKITFPTEAAALAAGYTLAGNCAK